MGISSKIRTIFRGDISLIDLPREAMRRKKSAARQRDERRDLDKIKNTSARLAIEFSSLSEDELLRHFRERDVSFFPPRTDEEQSRFGELVTKLFPEETASSIAAAQDIVDNSRWELAGLGQLEFKPDNLWRTDPLNGKEWGLEYHADVVLYQNDGADIRVLWELNRFGHAVTLALAFAVTDDEAFAETWFSHVEGWMTQNPCGRGANWTCAMETALRAVNLLAAFDIFRHSQACTPDRLKRLLQLFDQHGRFISDNNEFSYIATSNHYLSDVVGLFWIGTLLPELEFAEQWRDLGRSEMLREMDKQILPDGADFESSTGYHKFVTEMLLFSFLLGQQNGTDLPDEYWQKIRQMLGYIGGIIRPDESVPLIGDCDGSQIIPVVKRDADDQAYLLALATAVFDETEFKEFSSATPELLWLLGEKGLETFERVKPPEARQGSVSYPNAGACIMRDGDLYLHFNANDCGVNGRGSHGHNDALSIEISAFGRDFVVDPGSYAYNLDRNARQIFRSTAYHSTVMVDGVEQNTTNADLPFFIGNEARPVVIEWRSTDVLDLIVAEHFGYERLPSPIRHRRSIQFNKTDKYWIIEDELVGTGSHEFGFRFHLSPGIAVQDTGRAALKLTDEAKGSLLIEAFGIDVTPEVIPAFVSRNYGHREAASILEWKLTADAPLSVRFIVAAVGPNENVASKLELMGRLTDNIGT